MKKLLTAIAAILSLVLLVPTAYSAISVTDHKIVIDAGHGGDDFGSTECEGYPEKDANLDIAERLKALLEADGATVYMTRTDDSTLSNNDRYTLLTPQTGKCLYRFT